MRSRKFNIVFSLLLAVALWGFVVLQVNPQITETFSNVPVNFINEDELADESLVLTGPAETSIEVTVKGSRSDVRKIEKEDIHVTCDLAGLSKGEHTVRLSVSAPTTAMITEVNPDKLVVTIAEKEKVH